MNVIPATIEVEVKGLWNKASLGKSMRPYLKSKLKQKNGGGGGMWLKW
jgi:hypothetical protein